MNENNDCLENSVSLEEENISFVQNESETQNAKRRRSDTKNHRGSSGVSSGE